MAKIFEVRIYKSLGGSGGPRGQHSNVYHISSENEMNTEDMVYQVTKIVEFEKAFHNDNVTFRRAVVKPYAVPGNDPANLRTIALSGNGTLVSDSQIEPREITLKCAATPELGRAGGCYYRGALVETDVNAEPGGDPQQENNVASRISVAWNTYFAGVGNATIVLPFKGDADPTKARPVSKIVFQGIICKKATNRRVKKNNPTNLVGALWHAGEMVVTAINILSLIKKLGPAAGPAGTAVGVVLRRLVSILEPALLELGV